MNDDRAAVPHEIERACGDAHCHVHHVDEPADEKTYVVCFECNHVYPTARALRQAYRRALRSFPTPSRWISDEWGIGRLWLWRRLLLVRAKKIHFCQECLHDF